MPALCHFYPGLNPEVLERMPRREVHGFVDWMNDYQARQEAGGL